MLVAWQTAVTSGAVSAIFLPSPLAVINRVWLGLVQAGLGSCAGITLKEAFLGCLLVAVLALSLVWVLHHWRFSSWVVPPYVAASQAVPDITLAPLLVPWISYGTLPVMILCTFIVFLPITITVLLGLWGLGTDVIGTARLDDVRGLSTPVHIELSMTLSAIYTGLRTGFTLSITGAVVGEMIMGSDGSGMPLSIQRNKVDITGTFSTITLLCLLATTIHWALHELEQCSRTVGALHGRHAG